MNPICGWFLSSRLFARLAFKFYSGIIPVVCSGMNTEQSTAAHSYTKWAAVILRTLFLLYRLFQMFLFLIPDAISWHFDTYTDELI